MILFEQIGGAENVNREQKGQSALLDDSRGDTAKSFPSTITTKTLFLIETRSHR